MNDLRIREAGANPHHQAPKHVLVRGLYRYTPRRLREQTIANPRLNVACWRCGCLMLRPTHGRWMTSDDSLPRKRAGGGGGGGGRGRGSPSGRGDGGYERAEPGRVSRRPPPRLRPLPSSAEGRASVKARACPFKRRTPYRRKARARALNRRTPYRWTRPSVRKDDARVPTDEAPTHGREVCARETALLKVY